MEDRKTLIFNSISDRVSDLMYYDREEDEELPTGAIEKMVAKGEITVEEMVEHFKAELEQVCLKGETNA